MNKKVEFSSDSYPVNNNVLDLVNGFDQQELSWLSGYCAGLAKGKEHSVLSQNSELPSLSKKLMQTTQVELSVQILYASQTGNSQQIAESLYEQLNEQNTNVHIANLADFRAKELSQKQLLLFAISTHGEGEPPDDAIEFFDFLNSKRAPKLNDQQFAVIGLGDSSYEFFCQTGKDLESRLLELGATPLIERVDCDLDYESQVQSWHSAITENLKSITSNVNPEIPVSVVLKSENKYSKNNPYAATILANQRITASDSEKSVHHIELSIEDSGIQYKPGDGVSVWAKNDINTVKELLKLLALDKETIIELKGQKYKLQEALIERLEISLINKNFIDGYAAKVGETESVKANELLQQINLDYSGFLVNHQIVDIIALAPIKLTAQGLVDLLKPIKPRVYSISSSPLSTPDEIHLTVKLQQTNNDKKERFGTASRFLIQDLAEDEQVMIFIEENSRFRLPEPSVDILMVGPGTGVAPFRSFLLEREEQQATGKSWLFFGNAYFNSEFLYQLELQKLLAKGLLSNLSVAFSRDQVEKVYVQHRMIENSQEIWAWLNTNNASFYVCGDMNYMAKDVEAALLQIFQQEGEMSEEQAKDYLKALKRDGRYQRDVY